jgi:hypothetical protein
MIYNEAQKELAALKDRMAWDYETPPYDFIG